MKTYKPDDITLDHFPRESSWPTKFLLNCGAKITAKITSSHYHESPLLQGGLETRFEVSFTLPGTITNQLVSDHYREQLNCETKIKLPLKISLPQQHTKTEAYLEPSQTSTTELFCKYS